METEHHQEPTLAALLDADLERLGKTQDWLIPQLTDEGEPVITSSAVSMWKKRNRAPARRLRRMAQILNDALLRQGSDSVLARAIAEGHFFSSTETPHKPVAPRYEFHIATGFSSVTSIEKKISQFTKLLRMLPPDQQHALLDQTISNMLDAIT